MGFKKPFDVDAVMPGVFESYFCILDRIAIKGIQDGFQKFVEAIPVIGNREVVRVNNAVRVNDEAVMLGFGNINADIEHKGPPLVMEK